MAGKKGTQVQLQSEINNDEEWNDFIEKKGILIIDVYSDWCGPCTAMVGYLKKIKLELGGDNMHLAIAKSDNITCLERFRNRSEPTWMFLTKKKLINLLFGSNVPKLIEIIKKELEYEALEQQGEKSDRRYQEIEELTPDEKEKYEQIQAKKREMERIEREEEMRLAIEKHQYVFSNVAKNMKNQHIVVIWPQLNDAAPTLSKLFEEHGLTISYIDRSVLTQDKLDKWIKFAGFNVSPIARKALMDGKSLVWLLKMESDAPLEEPIEDTIARIVYGESKQPLGDEGSPAAEFMQKRLLTEEEIEEKKRQEAEQLEDQIQQVSQVTQTVAEGTEITEDPEQEPVENEPPFEMIPGLWIPLTPIAKATVAHTIFPKLTTTLLLPEPQTVPPHLLVMFEAFKRKEVLDTIQEFRDEVLHYGFFTGTNPQNAKLVYKTIEEFDENIQSSTYDEKLALAVVKTRPHPLETLISLGPIYVSENWVEGVKECALLFPDDYEPKIEEKVEEEPNSNDENEGEEGDENGSNKGENAEDNGNEE